MLHPPHVQGGRVAGRRGITCQWMWELVAEEFIVDLLASRPAQGFWRQFTSPALNPFRGSQMKQFCRVAVEYDDGPAGEELIALCVGLGEAESAMKWSSFGQLPWQLCTWIRHGWLALRHSSLSPLPF